MTEESINLKADIRRLEERIDTLRWAVIVLTILISLLYIILIFQYTPFLPYIAAIGVILLCLFLLVNNCTKGSGAPAGT